MPKRRSPPPWAIEDRARMFREAASQLTLLFAIALTHSAQAQVPARNDHLIVPSKRIGAAELGMTTDELIRGMGEPASKWPGVVDIYNWRDGLSATVTKDGLWT